MDKTTSNTEELYEALIELANERAISQKIIHESDNLLKGLRIIVEKFNKKSILVDAINALREILGCEDVIIMAVNSSHQLTTQASTSDLFSDLQLEKHEFLERIINGDISISFDILTIPEWRAAPEKYHHRVKSSIHIGLAFTERETILICCDSRPNFFNRTHADLINRYASLVTQALINISTQNQIDVLNGNLLDSARHAGMAEVAANVMHSVGNVLNSLAVSSASLKEKLENINADKVIKLINYLKDATDEEGENFKDYKKNTDLVIKCLTVISQEADANKADLLEEVASIISHISNINSVVSNQQEISRYPNMLRKVVLSTLIDNVLKEHEDSIIDHKIIIDSECKKDLTLTTDEFQLKRIISNVILNAINALIASGNIDKKIYISCDLDSNNRIIIKFKDNGIGIMPEDTNKIFNLGFSTEKARIGYGLHYSAIAANSLGGNLHAISEGVGKGTEFILSLNAT